MTTTRKGPKEPRQVVPAADAKGQVQLLGTPQQVAKRRAELILGARAESTESALALGSIH